MKFYRMKLNAELYKTILKEKGWHILLADFDEKKFTGVISAIAYVPNDAKLEDENTNVCFNLLSFESLEDSGDWFSKLCRINLMQYNHFSEEFRKAIISVEYIGHTLGFKAPEGMMVRNKTDNRTYKIKNNTLNSVIITLTELDNDDITTKAFVCDIDWSKALIGYKVKIVNSCDNPSISPDDRGAIGCVIEVDEDGSLIVDGWSKNISSDAKVKYHNVVLISSLKKNDFCELKTYSQLLMEYGKDWIINNMEEYIYHYDFCGDKPAVISQVDSFYTDIISVYVPGKSAKQLNAKYFNKDTETKNFLYYSDPESVAEGDNVYVFNNHEDKVNARVIYKPNNDIVLLQYTNPALQNPDNEYYGIGTQGMYYEWKTYGNYGFVSHEDINNNNNNQNYRENLMRLKDSLKIVNTDNEKINVGDSIVIKNWDEMINEFGRNEKGEPKMWRRFSNVMSDLCGKKAVVDKIYPSGAITLKDWESDSDVPNYLFSTDMIRHASSAASTFKTSNTILLTHEEWKEALHKVNLNEKVITEEDLEAGDILMIDNMSYYRGTYIVNVNSNGDKFFSKISSSDYSVFGNLRDVMKNIVCVFRTGRSNYLYNTSNPIYVRRPIVKFDDIELITGHKIKIINEEDGNCQ